MILALTALLVGWLVLPFVPALHEAYRRRDSAPLALSDRYREDRRLGLAAAAPASDGETDAGALADAGPDGRGAAAETFDGAPGLHVSELRVRGVARLGVGTVVARRLVAGDSAEVGAGSVLHGSAEAGDVLWLGPSCRFERLHAPTVCTGARPSDDLLDDPAPARLRQSGGRRPPGAAFALPEGTEVLAGRALVTDHLALPDGAHYDGDLVVHGDLSLGAGACVRGSVKARGAARLAAGAVVTGHVVSGGDVSLAAEARVGGAALAEGTLSLGDGTRVGRPGAPSTATGREVTLADGVTVYGTVWARERGESLSA